MRHQADPVLKMNVSVCTWMCEGKLKTELAALMMDTVIKAARHVSQRNFVFHGSSQIILYSICGKVGALRWKCVLEKK